MAEKSFIFWYYKTLDHNRKSTFIFAPLCIYIEKSRRREFSQNALLSKGLFWPIFFALNFRHSISEFGIVYTHLLLKAE